MSTFRIEFLPITAAAERGFQKIGMATDRLTGQFARTSKAALDVQEATLKVEQAQNRAAAATTKYGEGSLKAAQANVRLARTQEQLAATTRASALNLANVGSKMAGAGAAISGFGHRLSTVSLGVAALGVVSGKMSVDFGAAMERVHTQAGASQREVDSLKNKVLALAQVMPQGPQQLAEGLYHLESIGLRGAKAMSALKIAAEGAAVGNANLEDTASALGSAWLTNIKGAGDLHHVMGLLNATVGAGNMRMNDLVEALGTGVLPSAKVAGLGLRDVMGALAVLTDENYKGSSAMAQFATALHFLYAPTGKAAKALDSIGLSSSALAQDMHKPQGLLLALTDLHNHLSKLSTVDQEQTLGKILPGGRGRVMLVLLNQLDRYQMKLDQITRTSGRFGEAVQKTQETPLYRLKAAWSGVRASLVDFGDKLIPIIVPILEKVGTWVTKLSNAFGHLPHSWQTTIVGAGLLVAALSPIAIALGGIVRGVGSIIAAYGKLLTWNKALVVSNEAVVASEVAVGAGARTSVVASVAGARSSGLLLPAGVRSVEAEAGGIAAAGGASALARGFGRGALAFGGRLLGRAGLGLGIGLGGDLIGQQVGGRSGSAISGAAKGAGVGMLLGPEGALAGAVAGAAISGITQSRSIRSVIDGSVIAQVDKLHGSLKNLDSFSLNRLAASVHKVGGAFAPARKAAADFAHVADKELGGRFTKALDGLSKGPKFNTVQSFLAPIENQFRELPPKLRQHAGEAIVQVALQMERDRRLPKGATDRIISDLKIGWRGLDPYLRGVVARSMKHVSQAFSDQLVVDSVQKQVDTIGKIWGDAPRLAKATGENVNATWQIELAFLRQKIKDSTGKQKEDAQHYLDVLQKMGAAPADVVKHTYSRINHEVRAGWRKLADYLNNNPLISGPMMLGPSGNPLLAGPFPTPKHKRMGGVIRQFVDGGLVPAYLSSGEEVVYGNSSWTVPGSRVADDNVLAMLPVGAAVLTGHGQQLASAGMGLGQVLASQAPHFRAGGPVLPAFQSGGVIRGRVSTFGPPGEAAGRTASGLSSAMAGIALNLQPGTDRGWNNATTDAWVRARKPFMVNVAGHHGVLPVIDKGPAGRTGRAIDVTGAGARRLGFGPAGFPTDAVGTASPVGGSVSFLRPPSILHPRLVDIRQPYGALDAFQQGFDFATGGIGSRLFTTPTGMDSDLFKAAISGVSPNVRDVAQRVTVSGASGKRSKSDLLALPSVWRGASAKDLQKGIFRIASIVMGQFPDLAATSTTGGGHAKGSYHYKGEAVDLAGTGMNHAAAWIRRNVAGYLAEGIHNPNLSIKYGKAVDSSFWGAKTWRAHAKHIHLAATSFRRGGIAGQPRFRSGGTVSPHSLISTVGSAGVNDNAKVIIALRRLGVLLDTASKITYDRLAQLDHNVRSEITHLAKGGLTGTERIQVRRLRAVLTLIEARMGARIGFVIAGAQKALDVISERQTSTGRRLAITGIDPASITGLQAALGDDRIGLASLSKRLGDKHKRTGLYKALDRARGMHQPAVAKSIIDQITSISGAIGDTQVDLASKGRDLAHAQRYDPVNAQYALDQLSGDTPAQRADLQRLKSLLTGDLADAVTKKDYQAIQDLIGQLQSVNGSLDSLNQTQKDMTDALKAAAAQLEIQNHTAAAINRVETGQAMKALADIISGQIAGRGYGPRSLSAGDGTLARY